MVENFGKFCSKFIIILFYSLSFIILFSNIIIDKRIPYALQVANKIPNFIFFFLSLIFIFLIVLFLHKKKNLKKVKSKLILLLEQKFFFFLLLIILFIFLFIIQLYIVKNIYFITNWDVSIVLGKAEQIAKGNEVIGDSMYYSQYPTNVLITFVLSLIQKTSFSFGWDLNPYFVCTCVDCILINIAGLLTVLSIYKITKRKRIVLFSLIPTIFLIVLSPWMVIPYTDSFSILFPILIFFIYITIKKKWSYLSWFFIGLLGMISFYMKPNCFIVLIALFIIELISMLIRKNGKEFILQTIFMLIGIGIANYLHYQLFVYLECDLIENLKLPFTHFMMMGVNNENGGAYISSDYMFSSIQPTLKIRITENLRVYFERIQSYGFFGTISFYIKKTLSAYNDGTFAWGNEGNFFTESLGSNGKHSEMLRNIFYTNGTYYSTYKIIVQGTWIFIQTGIITSIFTCKKSFDKNKAALYLMLIGMFFYIILFEMRARYLFNFIPFFIVIAFISITNIPKIYNQEKNTK